MDYMKTNRAQKIWIFVASLPFFQGIYAVVGYTNFQEADRARNNAYVAAFDVPNLFTEWTPEGLQKWQEFIDNITPYINTILAKKREIGRTISDKNRKLFEEARITLSKASKDLLNILREKDAVYSAHHRPEIKEALKKARDMIKAAAGHPSELHALHANLEKGLLDIPDTRDLKKFLQNTAITIREVYKKLIADYNKKIEALNKDWNDKSLAELKVDITFFK